MPRRYSISTSRYTVPNFDGLTVRQRAQLLETLLPKPTTQDEAIDRAQTGLYAIERMSCMLMEQLWEDQDFSGKTPLEFWSEVAFDCERRFQGNITSALGHKLKEQRRLARKAMEKKLKKELYDLLARKAKDSDELEGEMEWISNELYYQEDAIPYLKGLITKYKAATA